MNYIFTENDVFTGKSRTWTLPILRYGRGLRFSRKDRAFEVNKLFIICHFASVLRARN